MENNSRAEALEEEKRWELKFFDYAENPIKEWIAKYLEETTETIFDDYKEESDVIGVEENGDHYILYLTSSPTNLKNGSAYAINLEDLKNMPNVARASKLLFDSVCKTYGAIVQSMSNLGQKMEDVFPKFVSPEMYFKFMYINREKMEREKAQYVLSQIEMQLVRIRDVDSEDANKLKEKLVSLQDETIEKLNKYTEEEVSRKEKLCTEVNEKLDGCAKLYMVAEKNEDMRDEDEIMKRMPEIGRRYEDPDDEPMFDKIQRENLL